MIYKKAGQKPMVVHNSIPTPVNYKKLLEEAIAREDYELAALLRDRLKGRRVRKCEKIIK